MKANSQLVNHNLQCPEMPLSVLNLAKLEHSSTSALIVALLSIGTFNLKKKKKD